MSPPITGISRTSSHPRSAISAGAKEAFAYQKTLVAKAISLSNAHALNAPPVPATTAIAARMSIR